MAERHARTGSQSPPENRRKTGEANLARGHAFRFKPGQSGNPGGRPRTAKLSEACRAKLASPIPRDGAVPIDNNVSEREMKRVVLNRKNSLFVGNPRGGRTAAILASLTSSCRRHEMDPQLYFMQLLMNLPSWPANDIDAWLPDRWKKAHAARCEALEIPPLDS